MLINLVLICFAISKMYDCALPYIEDMYNASVGTSSQTTATARTVTKTAQHCSSPKFTIVKKNPG